MCLAEIPSVLFRQMFGWLFCLCRSRCILELNTRITRSIVVTLVTQLTWLDFRQLDRLSVNRVDPFRGRIVHACLQVHFILLHICMYESVKNYTQS